MTAHTDHAPNGPQTGAHGLPEASRCAARFAEGRRCPIQTRHPSGRCHLHRIEGDQ